MSFLSDKTSFGKKQKPFFAMIYGEGGVGKSRLCSYAQNPYFLDLEGGIFNLDVPSSNEVISDPNVLRSYMEALLKETHPHKTIIIDSLSALEPIMMQSVLNKFPKENGSRAISIEDYGYGKGYVHLLTVWHGFLGMLKKMNARGLNVILIGHRKIASFELPNGGGYKYYTLNLFDSDKNSVLRLLTEQSDFVGYMVKEALDEKNPLEQRNPKKKPGQKKLGKRIVLRNRIIYTEATQEFYAKTRFDLEPQYKMDEWEWDLLSIRPTGLEQPEQINEQTTDTDEQADEDEKE